MNVYLMWYCDEDNRSTLLGIFSSKKKAEEMKLKIKDEYVREIDIFKFELNQATPPIRDQWGNIITYLFKEQ